MLDLHIKTYTCKNICIYIYTQYCIYIYLYIYICICVYIYIYAQNIQTEIGTKGPGIRKPNPLDAFQVPAVAQPVMEGFTFVC